jgi:hypothetical protein
MERGASVALMSEAHVLATKSTLKLLGTTIVLCPKPLIIVFEQFLCCWLGDRRRLSNQGEAAADQWEAAKLAQESSARFDEVRHVQLSFAGLL